MALTDMHGDDADVILVENDDLTNVLSQLNTNVFEDIFTGMFYSLLDLFISTKFGCVVVCVCT